MAEAAQKRPQPSGLNLGASIVGRHTTGLNPLVFGTKPARGLSKVEATIAPPEGALRAKSIVKRAYSFKVYKEGQLRPMSPQICSPFLRNMGWGQSRPDAGES